MSSLQSKSECLAPPINRKVVLLSIRHHMLDSPLSKELTLAYFEKAAYVFNVQLEEIGHQLKDRGL